MLKSLSFALVGALMLAVYPATVQAATTFDWSPCKKEIGLWCKSAADDEAMYTCLHGGHDAELSKPCDDKAITPYEDKSGKPHG